jgi:hypothetical protein
MYIPKIHIASKADPLHWLDLPNGWTLDNGQLHINGKAAIGSAKRGIRYVKHPATKRWYPVAYVVILLATRTWPAFGVLYRDPTLPPERINHVTNLVPATKDDANAHAARQRLTTEQRRRGGSASDGGKAMKRHWSTIRGTDEEARRHDGLNRRKAMTVEWALSFCADMEAMTAEGNRISKKAKRTWDRARVIVLAAETAPLGLSVLLPPNLGEANF